METSYERTTSTKTYNVTHSVPPHSLVITRTGSGVQAGGKGGGGGGSMTRSVKISSGGGGGGGDAAFNEGQYAMVTATGVSAVKDTRDEERKEMQDLNERFANYIEKVRARPDSDPTGPDAAAVASRRLS